MPSTRSSRGQNDARKRDHVPNGWWKHGVEKGLRLFHKRGPMAEENLGVSAIRKKYRQPAGANDVVWRDSYETGKALHFP